MTSLGAIEWVNFDEPLSAKITEARRDDQYVSGNFPLVSERPQDRLGGYGVTSLPSGIDDIYCDYYVLGPSIMAVVFTFVLAADEAKRIDVAFREEAESRLNRLGRRLSRTSVREVKRERIRSVQGEVTRRCLEWLKNRMPGTLSAGEEGVGPPTCALISLAAGKPFDTEAEYMGLLALRRPGLVERFLRHDFLFLVHPTGGRVEGWMVAAFNEADAVASGWIRDPEDGPPLFHLEIASLMIADGLHAALRSFGPRLQSIRADLNRLDIDKPAGTQVIGLRNGLLGLSREISTVCGDVTVFVDEPVVVGSISRRSFGSS